MATFFDLNMNRRDFISSSLAVGTALVLPTFTFGSTLQAPIKIGIIGLDTSHSPAFVKYFNVTDTSKKFSVVAAYPYGSKDIESSVSRIPKYTEEVKGYGVTIVDSIKKLLSMVDVVLLETNDGRPHKEQAFEVINAGKPMFIDKPIAASFDDVRSIYEKARTAKVPIFSSSSLRYMKTAQDVRYNNSIGKVLGADTFSPATLEPHHPDLFWYGIHGVEILIAVMGKDCKEVVRINTADTDIVVGTWRDGRTGTFRGTRTGTHDYGGTVFGEKGNQVLGPFKGYDNLLDQIITFFKSGIPPVSAEETLAIYTFMEAADESKRRNGAEVTLKEVMDKARAEIAAKK